MWCVFISCPFYPARLVVPSLDKASRVSGEPYMPKAARDEEWDFDVESEEVREARARWLAHAISRAPDPSCEAAGGWWIVNSRTGRALPRNCKRWACPSCRRYKRLAVLVALQHGLAVFHEQGHEIHALTLTDGDGGLDFARYYAAWDRRIRPWLQRHDHLHAYASALEVQPRSGRLHGHMLLIAPAGRSGMVPHDELHVVCKRAGLGYPWIERVTDVPAVSSSLAAYFVKGTGGEHSIATSHAGRLGSYMAKATEVERLAGLSGKRLRPFRTSRNWPLGLGDAQKRLRDELFGVAHEGEWHVVNEQRLERWLTPLREQAAVAAERDRRWKATEGFLDLLPLAA